MDEKTAEKAIRELKQLKSMNPKDAVEILFGYHKQLVKGLSNAVENVKQIVDLSPSTIALTNTAVVIAEKDCLDGDGEIELLSILGSTEQVANIIDEIFKKAPNTFEEICKRHHLVEEKPDEEKTA